MNPGDIKPAPGSRKSARRVGRGPSSGSGKTSGKGHKGQKARSGGTVRPGFEGGQMPMQRRLPKRGFRNIFRNEYAVLNLKDLERLSDVSEVTPELLVERRVVKRSVQSIKLLGEGDISRAVTVRLHAVSASAREKITAAGGKVEDI